MTSLAAEHLTVRRGGETILADLSLSLGPTGSVAVIGPNGAGKSTLLKMLAGIERPSSGLVRADGQDLVHLPGVIRAATIGYLPQYFEPHWDLTVRSLVRLGAERAEHVPDSSVEQALATFELAALQGRRWSTLSGGERARVLLAMVLVVGPPVLLADEPGASLDIRHRLDLVETLVRRRDRLSIVVMHDLDLAFRFFDRVIMLERGRVIADEAAGDLFNDARLDAAFGVKFERLKTSHGFLLHAKTVV